MFAGARRHVWLELGLATILACLVLGYQRDLGLNVFDEGLVLYGAARVGSGDLPYRDFWTTYAPGSYYLTALVFHVFGASVGVVRDTWVVIKTLVAVETLILARRLGGRLSGWLAFILTMAVTIVVDTHSGYNAVPAMAATLAALIALSTRALVVCGVLVGLVAVFRHDFGAYAGAAMAAGLFLRALVKRQWRVSDLLRFVGAAGLVVVPVYGLFAWKAGIHTITDALIVFPATRFADYYSLPWSLGWRWFVVPAIAVSAALACVTVGLAKNRSSIRTENIVVVVVLSLLALGFLNYAAIRLDRYHSWPMTIAAAPLIAAAPFTATSPGRRRRVAVVVAGIVTLYVGIAIAGLAVRAQVPVVALSTQRGAGVTIPTTLASYNDLLFAIHSQTSDGEPIFSGATHHDRISANDVLLYFLTERPAVTPYYELNRSLMADESVHAEIVRGLERRSVRLIVLLDAVSGEPNRSSISNGITMLDDYIRTHYTERGRFGNHHLLVRE